MLQIVGVLIIVNALVALLLLLGFGQSFPKGAYAFVPLACVVGLALVFNERAIELSFGKYATLKAAAQRATVDANDIAEIKKQAENDRALIALVAKEAADAKRVAQEGANQVAEITKQVETQSATVDLAAQKAAALEGVAKDLTEKSSKAEEKLSTLERAVVEGNRVMGELRAHLLFSGTILAAQNDDRRAYDQLWVWAEDNSFPLRRIALQAVQTILEQHNPTTYREGFSVPWSEGIDPQKLSLSQLRKDFGTQPPHVRIGIVEFAWKKRTDISKQERLQFLVDVLRTDESLRVVEYAGRYFAAGTGDKFKPIAVRDHLKWWDENKDSVK